LDRLVAGFVLPISNQPFKRLELRVGTGSWRESFRQLGYQQGLLEAIEFVLCEGVERTDKSLNTLGKKLAEASALLGHRPLRFLYSGA
jgi:hypothetical protein